VTHYGCTVILSTATPPALAARTGGVAGLKRSSGNNFCLDPNRNGFPAYLDLEQQGLFVLGYHQMRKWLWMPKEDRANWEQNHQDAPKAYLWSA